MKNWPVNGLFFALFNNWLLYRFTFYMKTKSNKTVIILSSANDLRPHLDLFGDVAITIEDQKLWVKHVARIDPDSWRFDWYVKNWNVTAKIKAAKLNGRFDSLTNDHIDKRDIRWI